MNISVTIVLLVFSLFLVTPAKSDEVKRVKSAERARYIVNQAEWASVATISTRKDIKSFPTVSLVSVSDGKIGKGSGIPYMYLTPLDFISKDISKDNRVSLMMTLAQGDYCKLKDFDPMDPRCSRVILTGRIVPVENDSEEHQMAKKAVFRRHPWLANMPSDHHFFFAKLEIAAVLLMDGPGGAKFITEQKYLSKVGSE